MNLKMLYMILKMIGSVSLGTAILWIHNNNRGWVIIPFFIQWVLGYMLIVISEEKETKIKCGFKR